MSKLQWLISRLRKMLWVRVSLFALAGVAAAALASLTSRFFPGSLPFDISADAIDSLLSIIASSMLAVTTFSVGALTSAYGSATSNGTARATQLLTQDRVVQNSLATFVGSFLFSIVGLIALKVSFYGPEGRAVLFIVSIAVVFLIVLALLRWINQLTRLGRVSDTVERIETEARASMDARLRLPFLGGAPLPDDSADRPGAATEIRSPGVGYLNFIETARLSQLAQDAGLEIDIHVLPGAFLYADTLLARVRPGPDAPASQPVALPEPLARTICQAFSIAALRSYDQDPRFGLVVLTEVALRALSPAVNDPGTGIDVIGRQTRLLTHWAAEWDAACTLRPDYPRLRLPGLRYDDLFEDAFNLIGRDGAGQIDVMLRLVKSLMALSRIGPEASRDAARAQLRVALSRAEAALPSADDRRRLAEAVAGFA